MGDIANRLGRLEARTPPPAPVRPGSVTLDEIQALEEHIRRLEADTDEVRTAPEVDFTKGAEPDNEIAAVEREIERLKRLEQTQEGSTRWGT